MLNPPAGRKALLEMLRVTKIGGEIRIGPMGFKGGKAIHAFLKSLKEKGLIEYELVEPTQFPEDDEVLLRYIVENQRKMSGYYHYAKATRLK
jgi:hypothetical protein